MGYCNPFEKRVSMLISTPSEISETIIGLSISILQRILRVKSSKKNTRVAQKWTSFFLLDPLSTIPLRKRMRNVDFHLFRTKNSQK